MDFLKTLFPEDGGALTYEQLEAAAREKKLNIVNLADGGYVSKGKFDDTTNTLKGQITTLQGQLTDRDNDLNSLREQLTAAQAKQLGNYHMMLGQNPVWILSGEGRV